MLYIFHPLLEIILFMRLFDSLSLNHILIMILLIIFTIFNLTTTYIIYKNKKIYDIFVTQTNSLLQQILSIVQIRYYCYWFYQRPILIYSIIMLVWFAPIFVSHQVILPFRPYTYANLEPVPQSNYIETTFFSDYLSAHIPEVALHLRTAQSGWIGLWTHSLEFGRPLIHNYALGPAYVISWILLGVIHDPYVYFTILFILLVYTAGLFGLLYAYDISGNSGVGLLAGLLLAFTPSFFFWNSFPMFIAPTTWGMACFYGFHRIRHHPQSRWPILLVAFAVYSLIYMAYPQTIIHLGYIFIGYFCGQLWQLRTNRGAIQRYIGSCSVAVGLGGILTLPLLLDLITASQLSILRQQITPKFFIGAVANITTAKQLLTTVFSFGLSDVLQPITTFTKSTFPIQAGYVTFNLLIFVCIGICTRWRQVWGWVVWLVIAVAFSFRQDIFAFGYFHGLPQLSRGVLFGGGGQQIPLIILALHGLYSIFTRPHTQTRLIALISAGAGLQYIGLTVAYARWQQIPIQWPFVGIELLILCGITLAIILPHTVVRTLLLSGVLLCNAQFSLRPLLLTQPQANVITSSPTANAINASLAPDGLMAMITVKPTNRLEPNFSSVLGIHQIGTYSSLQSIYYVTLMKRFNVKYDNYIRSIRSINPPLPANDLWMTNIRTIVSDKPLNIAGLTFITRVDGLDLYRTADGMGCCLRVPASALRTDNTMSTHLWIDNPQATTNQRLTKKVDYSDEFQLVFPAQAEDSVIIFNQQFHPDWMAQVQTPSRWQPTTTVVINDVYQAVRIPAGTTALSFQFRPWIRWSLVANLFWLLLGGIWLYHKITHIYHARRTLHIRNLLV